MKVNKLFTSVVIATLVSCNKQQQENFEYMHLTVVADPTDFHLLQCDPSAVLKLYDLQEHKEEAVSFRYTEITDMMLTKTTDIRLSNDQESKKKNKNSVPLFREKEIVKFYDSVKHTVNHANERNDSTNGKNNSEVFRKICSELSYLNQIKSHYKGLLCFSNLAENSSIISVYDQSTSKLLLTKSDTIQKVFEKPGLLPNRLDSIIIVFCYQPLDREDDKRFNALVNIYKQILTSRGAKVIVEADNNFYGLWSE